MGIGDGDRGANGLLDSGGKAGIGSKEGEESRRSVDCDAFADVGVESEGRVGEEGSDDVGVPPESGAKRKVWPAVRNYGVWVREGLGLEAGGLGWCGGGEL